MSTTPDTPLTIADRTARRDARLHDAAQRVAAALVLAHRGAKDGSLTETERLAQIDTLLHDAINDLGIVKNQCDLIGRTLTPRTEYGIQWTGDGPATVGHVSPDPDYDVHRDILADEALVAVAKPVKVTREVYETPWHPAP